ncbi:MAG: SNF2-related protein [Salinivirgaceae bacterium]|jgi:SNF2 family DNA or RNA helicase|nr:SNF2-related protein [Salinivirgaceae bacterium]
MPDIAALKLYIKNHISFHTTSLVHNRGKKLYKNDAVVFENYDDKLDKWKFFVEGSSIYEVHIKGANKHNIETSCTCPFDWGSTCKHVVASLLFVSDNINNREKLQLSTTPIISLPQIKKEKLFRSESDAFEITNYKIITHKFIEGNCESWIYRQIIYSWSAPKLNKINVTKTYLEFHLVVSGKKTIVKITSENDKALVYSNELSKTQNLKLSEAFCLLLIAKSKTPQMLYDLFNNSFSERESQILEKFGFTEGVQFDKYFSYYFDPIDGLCIGYNKNSTGLVSIDEKDTLPIFNYIDTIEHEDLAFNRPEEANEKRTLGFALQQITNGDGFRDYGYDEYDDEYDDEDDDYEETGYRIVPIIGKVNKANTMFSTHIEEYNSYSDKRFIIVKEKKALKTLDLIRELKKEEDKLKRFQLKQQVFTLLKNEKFIYLLNSYQLKKKNLQEITISPDFIEVFFEINKTVDLITADMKAKIGNEIVAVSKIDNEKSDNQFCTIDNTIYFVKNYATSNLLEHAQKSYKMAKTHKNEFFNKVIRPLSKNVEISFNNGIFNKEHVELDFNKKQVYLSEKNNYIIITPQVVYQDGVTIQLSTLGNELVQHDEKVIEYKRNFELENDFIDLIAEFHPDFETQKSRKMFYLHMEQFTLGMWFYKFFDNLQANNVEVYGLKDLKSFKYSPYKGKINTSVTSGQDWFEVDIAVSFGDNSVSLKDIRKAVINKERYIQLKDGSVGVLPSDWFHKLEKYFRNGEIKKNKLEISKLRFSIVDELFDNIDDAQILEDIAKKRKKLENFTEITKTIVPKEIKADLRHYQKEGLNWLNFLDAMQWGGILADDMGLGKTLQVLTFLQHLINKKHSTNLIVVPTTLLFNWEKEIEKFAPKLKAMYYYGTNRKKDTTTFKDFHLVFTTYGTLLRDIEMLAEFKFNYIIIDESQAIKNPASRRFKAVNLINAKNRIALSGTPIENGTFDLFAQKSFVNPGFFGGAKAFKDNYSNAIDKEGNETIANELQRIVNPFILRRTKEKVASELPAKTEDIIYCEMESEQRKIYDAYRNNYKNQLLNKIEDEGMGKSKMMVLEALTRLRQICDSPALLKSDDIESNESIKIKEIIRHITNKTANHKILIFSQFVHMLSLIKDELAKLNIEYEYLDGKSNIKQREKSVANFQKNNNLRVFLISIKAGGTGLNLTAADYVYIIDPWWNPAVENQAIDRCYRIGQDKKVFAYRMICKNTVEEKILNLQNKKKKIAGDIIQTDENIMKTLKAEDIKELFG